MKSLLAILFAAVAFAAAPANATEWKGYTFHPTTGVPEYEFLNRIADEVKEETGGALIITNTPGGTLPIKGNDIAQAVADGIIPFAAATSGTTGLIPVYGLTRLPMLFSNPEEVQKVVDEVMYDTIAEAMDKQDIKLLGFWWYPAHSIWTKEPIESMADIDGMKLRVTTKQQAALIEQYGAVPVQIATAEVAPALQQGIVDGVLTSAAGSRLWIEMLKGNLQIEFNYGTSLIIANKQEFEALPQDVQEKLQTAATKAARWVTETLAEEDKGLRQSYVDNGLMLVQPTSEELAEAKKRSKTVWVEEAKQIGEEEVLDKMLTVIGQ
tara:strand:+ start:72608 stop:73579 length:972 start_codon:yes stop_codon:yes gene_type:complete